MKLWLNGVLLESETAQIDPADRGFTLGDGVFETIRVAGGKPLRLAQHLARLFEGASILAIVPGWDEIEITASIAALLQANGLDDGVLRITLTRGPGLRGVLPQGVVKPTMLLTCGDLPAPKPPAMAIISRITCRNEYSPLSRIKSLNYLDSILALQEAVSQGADEAILLNTKGLVAEASAANIFCIFGDQIITPPVADGALPGIMRAALIEQFGIAEASLTVSEMCQAQAVFLGNAVGLRQVAQVNDIIFDLQNGWLQAVMDSVEFKRHRII